jgi:hypothetical protein
MQLTLSLKAPGFNHWTYQMRNWFQAFAFKCNLFCYSLGLENAPGVGGSGGGGEGGGGGGGSVGGGGDGGSGGSAAAAAASEYAAAVAEWRDAIDLIAFSNANKAAAAAADGRGLLLAYNRPGV